MKKESLFDDNARYTQKGNQIDCVLDAAIKEALRPYKDLYSPRELGIIAHAIVQDWVCSAVLDLG